MQRFFVTSPLTIDPIITDPDIVHQLTRVMRSQVGEMIMLFDGDGSEMIYEIVSITKKSLSLRGQERRFPKTEPERNISLYQAMPNKIEKIEYILQKGVEVGIRRFIFFRSDHSQKLIISDAKKVRLIAIAREALEQCGGLVMPKIEFFDQVSVFHHLKGGRIQSSTEPEYGFSMPQDDGEVNIVLDTTGRSQKIEENRRNNSITIWVGPEGGWSEKERDKMKEYGFIFARFGERVFRTETAGVVVAFAFLYA